MISIFIAYVLDILFAKPKWLPSPSAGLNAVIKKAEDFFRRRFKSPRAVGIALVLFIIVFVYLAVRFIIWDFNLLGFSTQILAESLLIYFALSVKEIKAKLEELKNILGEADNEQLIRSKIEFIAENTAVDITGVLFYAFLGGPVLVWIYKALNMLKNEAAANSGQRLEPGWLALKLSVLFDYIPSRLCIFVMPLASYFCKMGFKKGLKTSWEAAFADALGIQLGGLVYHYGLPVHKPYIGEPLNELSQAHVQNALKLMYVSSAVLVTAMVIINFYWNVL
jgi:adenosylcobinamide-phosphate synthase